MNKKKKFLIITNKTGKNLNDLYFGKFGESIYSKNSVKLWRNFYKGNSINRIKKNNIIINKKVNFFIDFQCIIFSILFLFSKNYKKLFSNLSLINIFSHFRLVLQIMKYIKTYEPKFILFTIEGHLWENLLIKYCKKKFRKSILIGYQFTKINYKSNIFKNLYNHPDYIFCSGNIDKQILKKKFNLNKLYIFGSPKYICVKNNNIIKKVDFLILPNSNEDSLEYLIKFIVQFNIKNQDKNLKFIIRNHPLMSLQNLNKIKKIISKSKNFKISKSSLISDLKKSKFLIFDESSISLYAYKFGTIPLYFDYANTSRLKMDYKFPEELIVKNQNNLMKIFKKKISKSTIEYLDNVSKNYFLKMNKFNFNQLTNDKRF